MTFAACPPTTATGHWAPYVVRDPYGVPCRNAAATTVVPAAGTQAAAPRRPLAMALHGNPCLPWDLAALPLSPGPQQQANNIAYMRRVFADEYDFLPRSARSVLSTRRSIRVCLLLSGIIHSITPVLSWISMPSLNSARLT